MSNETKGITRTYLSAAETAKLVRAALKKEFGGKTKFSVRSDTYSGGASIRVNWVDGPTTKMVEAVAKQFQGGGFDGMIDMKYHADHWLLPDGSTAIAHCDGTEGSMGTVPAVREWMPHPDAKLVGFGADFVFCTRDYSEAFLRRTAARLVRLGYPQFEDAQFTAQSSGSAYLTNHSQSAEDRTRGGRIDLGTLLHRECYNLMFA